MKVGDVKSVMCRLIELENMEFRYSYLGFL